MKQKQLKNSYLQILSALQETRQRILADMYLPLIHELKEGLHVVRRGRLQDDIARPSMARRRRVEQLLEVLAARCQNHLVCLELAT